MDTQTQFNQKLFSFLQMLARNGMHKAAEGFSGLLGQRLVVVDPAVRVIDFTEIPNVLGGPENEAVGIYLKSEGDISAQIMLILPYTKALELVDLMMGEPTGTTQTLGKLERSALGEVGNMTGSFFMNSVAEATGMDIRPTPPAVMVDMVGAILDIIVATSGGISDRVLLLQAKFLLDNREVEANFWVIPDYKTLEIFNNHL
jgi:chemotaxis protein CheC